MVYHFIINHNCNHKATTTLIQNHYLELHILNASPIIDLPSQTNKEVTLIGLNYVN